MASKRESHPDHEEGKIPIFTMQKMVEIFQDIANCWCLDSLFPISFPVESVNSSMPEEAVLEIAGKESQTPQSLVAGCPEMKTCVEAMEKNSSFGNSKAATSPPQIQTIKSEIKSIAGADNKVDICSKKDLVNNKSISRDRSSVLDGEEEIFTPDKENFSPNTLKMRFLNNKDKLEVFTPDKENLTPNTLQMRVLKNEESRRSHNSKANCAPNIRPDESISPASNKENQTPKVVLEKPARRPFGSWTKLEQKQGTMALKNRVERVPFELLPLNSGGKSRSDRSEISGHVSAVKSVTADDCGQILDKHTNPYHMNRERKRNWDVIVGIASLLDRDSRKALRLLQGLKGTRLIIPRMVIKELDSMKHQFSIFRRRSEAPLALEWIEVCVMKTKWWIHVQSTMEEGMFIAPTPPASAQTEFRKDSWTFEIIWSRRGKAATSPPQIQTIKSKIKSVAGADNKVDICSKKDLVNNKSISRDRSSVLDGEEEIFTPDKENFSPNTLKMRFLKNKDKLEVFTPDKENLSPNTLQMRVLKNEESRRSHNSKANCAPNIRPDESISPASNKENQTPKVVLEKPARRPFGSWTKLKQKQGTMALKNRVERVPFESLLMNSGGKSRSDRSEISGHVSAVKSITADDCGQILDKHTNPSNMNRERKRNWDMIVDTASLLDRDSRKALQLLQGCKGTRLIIPRMVIKELDSMKHQFSIFRRRSEASLALEWIEECVTKTKWWIHIQSTMEEGMLITPTPPASTQTQFSKDSWTFPYGDGISQPLSSCKRSEEIVSPTADDHILDFALLHRRKQTDGQLVLLSDDVTLKVKSMAEGLLCETVQEFRESLVNPFSERFLWANSSHRGLTWSCQDDVVLREKYSRFPSKKSVKGLKLILLDNSHYGTLN